MESYLTIKSPTQGSYKEKGSKFLAFAFPVKSEENIKQELTGLKKKFHDARHHCYAYVLNPDGQVHKAQDDGEPNHSAGDPILGQIRSKKLTNTLVVVVRYFGGTKLGVGGLIAAYRTAASDALAHATIVEEVITIIAILEFPYDLTSGVMSLIHDCNLQIEEQTFTETCSIRGRLQPRFKNEIIRRAQLMDGLIATFE